MTNDDYRNRRLHAIIYNQGAYFAARCPELTLVATSKSTPDEALDDLISLCVEHISLSRGFNLLDMIYFMAWQLGAVLVHLQLVEDGARNALVLGRQGQIAAETSDELLKRLNYARRQCEAIELGEVILDRIQRFTVQLRVGTTYEIVANEAKYLREAIEAVLSLRRFVFIPPARANTLDNLEKDWADALAGFPEAQQDIRDAVECYTLDKNTACIFHLMRVAEYGLRRLAEQLQVVTTDRGEPQPLEFADWNKIIAAIRNTITGVRKLPSGPEKQAQLQSWSETADHCEYMKDIWRNTVSHTRMSYKESDALSACERVREFMSFLARSLK
jgi:hypothetical protein